MFIRSSDVVSKLDLLGIECIDDPKGLKKELWGLKDLALKNEERSSLATPGQRCAPIVHQKGSSDQIVWRGAPQMRPDRFTLFKYF